MIRSSSLFKVDAKGRLRGKKLVDRSRSWKENRSITIWPGPGPPFLSCAMSSVKILSLPNELLLAIVAAGRELEEGSVAVQQLKPEWTCSQVCRRFRSVIVGAPGLWTLIDLDLHSDALADIANLYFTRSQACILSATLRESEDIENDPLVAEQLSVIVPHIHRIRQLRLFLSADSQIALAPLRHVNASNLERLEIRNTVDAFSANVELFSAGAQMLRFIGMKGITPHFPVPWAAALTHLELRRGEWRSSEGSSWGATLAAQCPSLAHLSLNMVDISIGRLHLPCLKFLHISLLDPDVADHGHLLAIFGLFDAPALVEFTINGPHADQILVLFNSTTLPHSSFPALTSLTFVSISCGCDRIPNDALPITSAPPLFPLLSSLSLIHQCFMTHLAAGVVSSLHTWPVLKTLTLCPPDGEPVGEVCDTLWNACRSKPQVLPKFRLPASLLARMKDREDEEDEKSGMDTELFDPTELINSFD
ncbi:hypothetical protein B0H16DRAFT_379017 [Mycena metata]|uniref:F-box domain-containing protein n=1 Tax=Mycena metata TaxID=1033252 RepID=A0AAD7HHQ0_9AGAR|nr:hypothetical protein B0H16DRAFT_379017 [Mycena metata]